MTMVITGVANTGGRIASLNRSARCSGWTRRLKEPWAPSGICFTACPSNGRSDEFEQLSNPYTNRKLHDPSFHEGPTAGISVGGVAQGFFRAGPRARYSDVALIASKISRGSASSVRVMIKSSMRSIRRCPRS
jgi:hypothetical protein